MNLPVRNQENLNKALSLFNQPVIDRLSVVRLIGYGETGFDNYWILKSSNLNEVYWLSCVTEPLSLHLLKEQNISNYKMLDNLLEYNGCPKEKTFILSIKHDDMECEMFGPDVGRELTGDYNNE